VLVSVEGLVADGGWFAYGEDDDEVDEGHSDERLEIASVPGDECEVGATGAALRAGQGAPAVIPRDHACTK
jgi:hypothetical protein